MPTIKIDTIQNPLYDYAKLYKGIDTYTAVTPKNIDEAVAFMEYAARHKIDVRIRGSGHTFNGVTLPMDNEILVFTNQLDHYCFESDGSLTAGAGAILWDVKDLAQDYGLDLMVYNGGWAGPSVGGFINAGGFGKGNSSGFYGGLWETINWITLIDAFGNLRTIKKEDALFPWLFGSYGQLGFIVEANFKLKKQNSLFSFGKNKNHAYPSGLKGRIPKRQTDDPNDNMLPPNAQNSDVLYWYNLLIAPEELEQAWIELAQWADNHTDIIKPEGGWQGPLRNNEPIGYHYLIKYINFHPPLLYPKKEDFLLIGIMSRLDVSQPANLKKVLTVEQSFNALAFKNKYRLYVQAQNFNRDIDFRQYYGIEIYNQFLSYKNELDPDHRINKYVFFQ